MIVFVLYCKSYRNDVLRVKRLLTSVMYFNTDHIPFYISTPECDRAIFLEHLGEDGFIWVSDEEICRSNPNVNWDLVANTTGGLSQQIIKSEFWRLGFCDSYMCLDSDSEFLRNFKLSDFLHPDGHPYTILHDGSDFLQEAKLNGKTSLIDGFFRESTEFKSIFNRLSEHYDFGPSPYLWSSRVWRALDEQFFQPQGLTIWTAFHKHALDARWYGEALLHTRAIPIHPLKPLFKVFHYHWQMVNFAKSHLTIENLAQNYLGVIRQSNWELELDPRNDFRSKLSRLARRIKRWYRND